MNFKGLLPKIVVEGKYVKSGSRFAEAVLYLYLGECEDFRKRLDSWKVWEEEYSSRGYKTISLDSFIEIEADKSLIKDKTGIKREKDEEPIFHAQIYRARFLGKIKPSVDLPRFLNEKTTQSGIYTTPST